MRFLVYMMGSTPLSVNARMANSILMLFVQQHSMGDLVVKKAYVLGNNDGHHSGIISETQGIMFIATPHSGAHCAKMLNNILSTTHFVHP